jgi:glucose/arabinose dehydrogenase
MKRPYSKYTILLFIGLLVFIIVAFYPKNTIPKDASDNYHMHCAGCHGVNLDKFKDSKWTYAKSPAKIEQIIATGIKDEGMPGFETLLSKDEIRALSEYILAESKSKSINIKKVKITDKTVLGTDVKYRVETVVKGLEIPWGIEFLPDGSLLIAERNGTLSKFTSSGELIKIDGLPPIRVAGQGGLMDLRLHPDYDKNGWIYISFSYKDKEKRNAGNTEIIRCKLEGNELVDIESIYKGYPTVTTNHHFGSRMEFDEQGYLYFSIGDRGYRDVYPQKLDNSNGKVHRLNADGTIPADNPFYTEKNAEKSVFSYGHRNIQGMVRNPISGKIWTHEHGPRGGDEINIIQAGLNYGWPEISFGINYNGTTFTNDTAKAGMEQPLSYYVPSIAPCGMAFVTGSRYGDWENSLLIGSLRFQYLERVILAEEKVVGHERLLEGIGRVREVKVSPDGFIYVGVENPGRILKIIPLDQLNNR